MTRRKRGGSSGSGIGGLSIVGSVVKAAAAGSNITLDAAGTGSVSVTSRLSVNDTTNATSASPLTGAIQVPGGAGVVENMWIGGTLNVGGTGINNIAISPSPATPTSGTFTSLTASGLTTLTKYTEVVATKTGATGTVTHDFTESNIWYHSSISANFTVNLTNVPTTDNRAISVSLHLIQGATGFYANGFQIDGSSQTIRWVGGATPSPQGTRYEIQTFTLIRTGATWIVTSGLSSHGLPPDGSTQTLAAPNAQFIKTFYPLSASGNYWIKPPGQTAYQIYCDMTNGGGGWMLVGRGREGAGQSGNNNWFQAAGAGSYSSGLQSGNITVAAGNYNPTYMPESWIRAAAGETWFDLEIAVSRPQIGDSYIYKGDGAGGKTYNQFRWIDYYGAESSSRSGNPTSYNGLPRIDQGTAVFYLQISKFTGLQGAGTANGTNYGNWIDWYGGAGANNDDRIFSWAWSGHGGSGTQPRSYPGTGNQLTGFSTGSTGTTTNARQYGTEGHALQFVTIWAR